MMTNPFRTPDDYELFLYSIPDQYPDVVCSTVTFVRIGMTLARVSGDIPCAEGYRLVIRER